MAGARAEAMKERPTREAGQRWLRRAVGGLLLVAAGGVACWVLWVYREIEHYANRDEARPADAIAVFGAAEYDGRPSPVLRARLEQGLLLYQQKLAPLIITLEEVGTRSTPRAGWGRTS